MKYLATKNNVAVYLSKDEQADQYLSDGWTIIRRDGNGNDVTIASDGIWLTERPSIEEHYAFSFAQQIPQTEN